MFSENECFNLFTWLESRRDEGYVRDLVPRAWGVVGRKRGVRWDPVHHLLTILRPGCTAPPQGPGVSEILPRQHSKHGTLLPHLVFISEKFPGTCLVSRQTYNFITSHLYAVCPVVGSPFYKYKARR